MDEIISVAGNIGAGKTTLLEQYRNKKGCFVITEPVEKWTDALEDFYNNPSPLTYFEVEKRVLEFYQEATKTILYQLNNNSVKYILVERSPEEAVEIFLHQSNPFSKGEKFEEIRKQLLEMSSSFPWTDIKYLWLNVPPRVCYERLLNRNRSCETEIPIEYLEELDKRYKSWLCTKYLIPRIPGGSKQPNNEPNWDSQQHLKSFDGDKKQCQDVTQYGSKP